MLKELSAVHMEAFRKETQNKYFQYAKKISVAPPKANVPRIKQKILEYEKEGKKPGGMYMRDMLRATAYYSKSGIHHMLNDLN